MANKQRMEDLTPEQQEDFRRYIGTTFNEPGGVPRINEEGVIPNDLLLTEGPNSVVVRDGAGNIPGGLVRIDPPSSDFDWLPFGVYRDRQGNYTTDFDPRDHRVETDTTYYLSPDGDDGNDGLSAASPKKSVSALLDALNATPPAGGATIILAPGLYNGTDGPDGRSIDFPCNMVCPNGEAIFADIYRISDWAPHSEIAKVYSGTAPYAGIQAVIDTDSLDAYGHPLRLTRVNSSIEVGDTAGAYYPSSFEISLRTKDDVAPGDNIWVPKRDGNLLALTTPQDIYLEGISFWGNQGVVANTGEGHLRLTCHRCEFAYARTSNGLEVTSQSVSPDNQVTAIMSQCEAFYNGSDGFGYRRYARIAEIGCYGVYNGANGWIPDAAQADNGSTTHDNVMSLRVNGTYRNNNDRNIHDITNTNNWLVGCVVGDALVDSSDPYESSNIVAGRPGQPDATRMWLEGCRSAGGSASDVAAYGNAVVRLTDCVGMTVRDGDGTIEDVW